MPRRILYWPKGKYSESRAQSKRACTICYAETHPVSSLGWQAASRGGSDRAIPGWLGLDSAYSPLQVLLFRQAWYRYSWIVVRRLMVVSKLFPAVG